MIEKCFNKISYIDLSRQHCFMLSTLLYDFAVCHADVIMLDPPVQQMAHAATA
jgi:hypothetical protein